MTTTQDKRRVPPAIPEIAQAFQNDPRTKLAQVALQSGSSTAPVAQGGYAWGDGLARALDGVLGGYLQKKQMAEYGRDEQALLDLRKQRGLDGMASQIAQAFAPQPVPVAPQSAPVAPQVPPQALAPPMPAQQPPMAPTAAVNPLAFAPPPQPAPQGGTMTPPFPASRPATRAPAPVQFVDPLAGVGRPTSGFGARKAPIAGASTNHTGQDYAAPEGTPVRAAGDGVVLRSWNDPKGGNSVLVRHPDGSVTGYAHLAAFNVKRGDRVGAGQPIGAVGSTGNSTGNHLHFTYRDPSGKKVNPLSLKFGSIPETVDPNTIQVQGANAAPAPNAQMEEVPDGPSAVARPVAPTAEAPTQSRTLGGAYRIMADGNRYESARGQELYDQGLQEQTRADEAATERRQRLKDMGYQSDLGIFANDASQRTAAGWDERHAAQQQNRVIANREDQQQYGTSEREAGQQFQTSERIGSQGFQAGENDKNRALQKDMLAETIQGRKDVADAQRQARRASIMSNPTGLKLYNDAAQFVLQAGSSVSQLEEFERKLDSTKTGGFILGNAPGLTSWSNSDIQSMEALSNSLIKASAGDLKGSLSDKDVDFLRKTAPSIRNTGRANREVITRMKDIAQRAVDFQRGKIRAMESGTGTDFLDNWVAYQRSVRPGGMSFEEWEAGRPKFGPDGKRL